MSEGEVVQKTEVPVTIDSLQADFSAHWHQIGYGIVGSFIFECDGLGVWWRQRRSSLHFRRSLGATGTLVMPTHSTDLTEPSQWENPPVPESWWTVIRETMPAYQPDLTPTRSMGVIAETFRKQKRRSAQRPSTPLVLCVWTSSIAYHKITIHWGLVWARVRRSLESTIWEVPSFFSAWVMTATRRCTLQNIVPLFQPNVSIQEGCTDLYDGRFKAMDYI